MYMGLIIYGAILYVIGKIAHIAIAEKIGFYMLIGGVILMGLSFIGINIPLPISAV